jgi:hypothetical protein
VKRNLIVISCFIVFVTIILFPPIAYHYIYPNINDDTATLFGSLVAHNYPYAGFVYIGVPLLWLAKLIHVSSFHVWMWFNLAALIPCGVALYFIGTKLFNWKIGLIMLFVPIFVSGGILEYQYMGIIYSLIEVVILIPLLLYCATKYILEKRFYQLVILVIVAVIASTFHPSGLYVPLITGVALVGFILYKVIKHNYTNLVHYFSMAMIAVGILVICIACIAVFSNKSLQFVGILSNALFNGKTIATRGYSMQFGLWMSFVTITIVLIIIVSIIAIIREKIKLASQPKIYLYFLSCWLVVLAVLGFGRISTDPIRAELDASVVIGLIATILLGIVFSQTKDKIIVYLLAFIILIGLAVQFNLWFRDNSAVKESDRQAIAYLNTLDYTNYNCNSDVPYWVYDQLISEKYSANATDLIIVRNKPMTPRSDMTVPEYIPHDYILDSQDKLVKSFINNGIEVDIYEK